MPDVSTKTIFFDALDLAPEQRSDFLDEMCAQDLAQRREVEALLNAHDGADSFLDLDSQTQATPMLARADRPFRNVRTREQAVGEVIGPYTITSYIGEGGFGMVYRAEQNHPVQRPVALKIIKPGMDSQQVLRRFELERTALAMMDHPGIARVYDAGAVDDGRPYVVMEFVEGQPLSEFCDKHRLSIRDRLRLFQRVCRAVQHAHQKGVIHRDLKPSNILVAMIDGEPTPRVIDFGIAKAMQGEDSGAAQQATAITLDSQIIGTPQYMSPEQASMRNAEIDTRSDIYSLGVVLYELLTGETPVDGEAIREGGWRAAEKLICEREPARPSSRVVDLGDEAEAIAARRHLDGHRLWRTLKGDLDWIVMHALDQDPDRRYPTAEALADDIERYLGNEPVSAGPPSRLYRLGKLARRNKLELVAASSVVLAILALAAGGVWFGVTQKAASEDAEQRFVQERELTEFMQSILLGVDPAYAQGEDTTLLLKILADARDRVDTTLDQHPRAAVNMLNTIGGAYLKLTEFETAEECFREGLAIGLEQLEATDAIVMDARGNLAAALARQHRLDEAEEHFLPVIAYRERTIGPRDRETLNVKANLGSSYYENDRYNEAVRLLSETYEDASAALGDDNELTLRVMNNLALAHEELGEIDKAAEMLQRVLEAQKIAVGPTDPRTLATMNNLAGIYQSNGQADEAIAMLQQTMDVKREIYAEDHPSLLVGMNNLAGAMREADRIDEAIALYHDTIEFAERILPENDVRMAIVLNGLANAHADRQENDTAIELFNQAIAIIETAMSPAHPNALQVKVGLARMFLRTEHYQEALELADYIIEQGTNQIGPEWPIVKNASEVQAQAQAALESQNPG